MAYYKEVGEGGYKTYLTKHSVIHILGAADNKSGRIKDYDNDCRFDWFTGIENGWKYIGGCRQIKITTMDCSSMNAKNSLTKVGRLTLAVI